MNKQASKILQVLETQFPQAKSELNFSNPFELSVAVILSAQCTDKRVNQITAELFKKYNTAAQFAALDVQTLAPLIYSCGFYNNKAKIIIKYAKALMQDYGGVVPSDLESLRSLLGRKTANVVYSVGFDGQAIAVDTHIFRVSRRLGLAKGDTPLKVEQELLQRIDSDILAKSHHLLLLHGRYVCKSQNPDCKNCTISQFCQKYIEEN